jgi:DNA-binding response OmpR family regulator
MKILIVDDEQLIREILSAIFEANGFDVLLASDGIEAVKVYDENDIDFVLMDIEMPKMDGFSAYQEMIKLNSTIEKKPYIMLMTGKLDRLEEARKAGIKVIEKPFEVNNAVSLFLELKNKKCGYFTQPFPSDKNVKF